MIIPDTLKCLPRKAQCHQKNWLFGPAEIWLQALDLSFLRAFILANLQLQIYFLFEIYHLHSRNVFFKDLGAITLKCTEER
jgi:hypothetical protein